MQVTFTPYGMATLQRGFKEAPDVARREMLAATQEAVLLLESDVVGRWPKHTGLSRASITSDAFSTPVGVLGLVGSAAPVVAFVELGTKPHTPPIAPLIQWVADILGKTGPEGYAAAKGIQRKIARQGSTGKILFRQALGRHEAAIGRMFEAAAGRVAAHLARGCVMSLETVRAALVALVQTVPDVGTVHGYERYVREEGAMQALYLYAPAGDVPQLRGWQLSNPAIEERRMGLSSRVLNKQTWNLRGYMALRDAAASQLKFDQLCEAIRAAFRADPTLGGLCTAEATDNGPDGFQKLDAGPVLFCGVLCHSALLQVQTWEYQS